MFPDAATITFGPREDEVGGVLISVPRRHGVVAGEYASDGEPDVLVVVQYAVDEDGNDVSGDVAKLIRDALKGA